MFSIVNTNIQRKENKEKFMKKVALVIDNSGSMTKEEMEKAKVVKMLPISFIVNGEEYYEDKNMSYEEFYQFLKD